MIKVLGIGNALVDIMTSLENDRLLEHFHLRKGSMQLVDREMAGAVMKGTTHLRQSLTSGGSAANTIHGLANLGVHTAFIGKVGSDDYGRFFHKDMEARNIVPKLLHSQTESGRAIALVSPDSERTFTTFLGAAAEMSPDELDPAVFEGYGLFHIEGYLVFNHDLILKALQLAKEKKMTISLDMASFNVVEANLDFLKGILREYVDIVFANEEEARAFTGKEAREALDELATYCNIAVVKVGKEGSWIKKGDEVNKVDAIEATSLDTTGAGDLYASGFLYGWVKGLPLYQCGKLGSLLAGKVIEVIGAKLDDSRWEMIQKEINTLA